MLALFSKLFIAHLLGDFIFFRRDPEASARKPWRSRWLVIHCILHFVFAWIALWNIGHWPYAVAIGLSHYVGDLAMITMSYRRPQLWFVADQLFHVLIVAAVAALITETQLTDFVLSFQVSWVAIAGLLAVTFPAAKLISIFLSQWPPAKASEKLKGMASAGLWIGILERLLIYVFITTGHWEGVGFLLAAKSIFRFGDLTNSKDIYLTEYIMVGTLLSFCLAVVAGIIAVHLSV